MEDVLCNIKDLESNKIPSYEVLNNIEDFSYFSNYVGGIK